MHKGLKWLAVKTGASGESRYMKLLLLHAAKFSYAPTRRASPMAEEGPEPFEAEEALVAFVTVEEGDDRGIVTHAVEDIIKQAREVKTDFVVVYPYAHLSSSLAPLSVARSLLDELATMLMERGLRVHKAPFGWYKSFEIKVHGHPMAEAYRSYAIGKERIPTLVEVSRDLVDTVYNDYLPRFGLILREGYSEASEYWRRVTSRLALDLSTCKAEGEVLLSRVTELPPSSCARFRFVGLAQPIRAYVLEEGVPSSEDRIRELLSDGLQREGDGLWVSSGSYRVMVALRLGEVLLANTNAILTAMVLAEISKLGEGSYTPMLPLRYSIVQAYVATVPPVTKDYVENVINVLRALLDRVVVDDRNVKLAEKLRRAGMLWSPYVVIVGKREEETKSVTLRVRSSGTTMSVPLQDFVSALGRGVQEQGTL